MTAVGFGPRSAWLAVRAGGPDVVAEALGLDGVRSETWAAGLERIAGAAFVTPPVDGWVLVVLDGTSDDDAVDLAALSRRFGEAQRFGTHRVVEYHEWQRWVDGEPVRRYRWVGDQGELELGEGTPAAAEAGIVRREDLEGDWDGLRFAEEETVLDVAAEWSVDPLSLEGRNDLPDGLLGTFPGAPGVEQPRPRRSWRLPRLRRRGATDLVHVDERKGTIVVTAYSIVTPGYWKANGWFTTLDAGASDDELGAAVLEAMRHCRRRAPDRNDTSALAPMFEAVGARGWSDYTRGVRSVNIYASDAFVLEPQENRGGREGLVPVPDSSVRLERPAAPELGLALREAFARATAGAG